MHLCNEHDLEMLKAVKAFNPYDLYSKSDDMPSVEELKVRQYVRKYMILCLPEI